MLILLNDSMMLLKMQIKGYPIIFEHNNYCDFLCRIFAHYYASLTASKMIQFTSTKYYKEHSPLSTFYSNRTFCYLTSKFYLDDLMAKLFLDDIKLDKNAREKIENLVQMVKDSFEQLLNENSWMDQATKKFAKEKLLAIKANVAASDIVFDEKQLERQYHDVS